jgi:colanic acid biosynthesis glycosyl transferase WcaI
LRILIHGLNFAPELVGVGKYTGEMAQWLADRGHEVRAVTAPPFNPQWKVADGFASWRYAREEYSGQHAELKTEVRLPQPEVVLVAAGLHGPTERPTECAIQKMFSPTLREFPIELQPNLRAAPGYLHVLRCPLYIPRHPSAAKRILHLASFALSSFPAMLRQAAWRPNLVLVLEPTLFCLPSAWLTARICGAKAWLHVQDFEADAGFELGLVRSPILRRAVESIEKKLLRSFGAVSTISEKMLARLEQKGVPASACRFFPNWVDTRAIFPLAHPSPLRAKLNIACGEVVALYAGTMGHKQGLDVLAHAAIQSASRANLRFVFCGEGPGKSDLLDCTASLPNVDWMPMQPLDRLNDLLNLADIHLLPQKADAADLVMPSKLTGMLASGRPVVAAARPGTQLAEAVEGRGIAVDPGDAAEFSHAIEHLATDFRLRERLGKNAREYALSELEKERVLSRFEQDLCSLIATG